jgi:hypothetical protein
MTPTELAAKGLRVKQLVWDGQFIANSPFGTYKIRCSLSGDWVWQAAHMVTWHSASSYNAAKAAVEADLVTRITAMIEQEGKR